LGVRKLDMETPKDSQYFQEKTQMEFRAQSAMDLWYQKFGFEIVSREGTKQRDLILSRRGDKFKVEEKYREKDWGDFLIEIIQDAVSNNTGWFYSESFDRMSYVILDGYKPKTIYWVYWSKFKDWFFEYLMKNNRPKTVISPAGYGLTINIAVPWGVIPTDIVRRFDYEEPA
jgi:hypothetical protein